MRITIEVPDHLAELLKARAQSDGVTEQELLLGFFERGLAGAAAHSSDDQRSALPSIIAAKKLGRKELTNASLQAILDIEDALKAIKLMRNGPGILAKRADKL